MGKHLVILPSLASMCDPMLVKKPANVLSVGRLSVATPLSGRTRELILERNCVSVASVGRSSALPRASLYPRGCTLGRSYMNAVTVGRPSSGAVMRLRKKARMGEKRHQGSDCGKTSSRKFFLMAHMTTHTGEKPYPFSDCRKAFHRSSKATAHKRLHARGKM